MSIPKIPIKGYGGSWSIVVLILFHAYFNRPVAPWMPTEAELFVASGKAIFRHLPGTKSSISQEYLEVNGLRLSCNFTSMGARGGCSFAEDYLASNRPASATYFWMATRWGFRERMLHSLTQDRHLLISPRKTFEIRMLNYTNGWKLYYQVLFGGLILTVVLCFIERLNIKRNLA
jgi:hypothetical protein